MKIQSALWAAAFLFALSASSPAKALNVGDKAPQLKIAKWVKGTETKAFKSGNVYVVEFWATWCGPCKASIPHLSEMAAKFKDKVNFIGVDVWEDPRAKDTSYFGKVEDFVKMMGDKMAYNVAIDGPDGFMATNWMKNAGENGIPTAFVIDKTGTVAWIGHPMAGLEEVLDQVLDGSWDVKAFAAARAAQKEQETAQMEIMGLSQSGKHAEALKKLDAYEAKYPDQARMLAPLRFDLLLSSDESKAYAFARKFSESATSEDAGALNAMAWTIVDTASLKNADFKCARDVALKAVKLTEESDPMIMDTLATAYFKCGDKASAISTEEKAIKLLEDQKGTPEMLKELKDRLETFKKG